MDVRAKYKVTGDIKSLLPAIKAKIMPRMIELVQQTADAYIRDLESHMGTIEGSSAYTNKNLRWEPLDEETLDDSPKFWYESGEAKQAVVVNIKVDENGANVFIGIQEGSSAYNKVLWNELGFTPEDGDKLIRRPLFTPLAELHQAELKEKLRTAISTTPIRVSI